MKILIGCLMLCFLFSCKQGTQQDDGTLGPDKAPKESQISDELGKDNHSGARVEVIVTEFPVKDELHASVILVPPVVLTPRRVFITGSFFVMMSSRQDTIFDVFAYPDFRHLFHAGVVGKGPSEFGMVDKQSISATPQGFNVFNVDSKKYSEVAIDLEHQTLRKIHDHRMSFDADDGTINGFMCLSGEQILYYSEFGPYEYKQLNIRTGESFSFSPYPEWEGVPTDEPKMSIYLRGSTAKPDGSRFATFYGNFKRWRIFSTEGELLRDITVKIPPYTDHLPALIERYTYYSYPFSTDRYIYVFCRNSKVGDARKESTELHIWDWQGNPVAMYELDKYLVCFTVDEANKKLYGVNWDEGNEGKIFSFTLPEIP